MPFQYPFSNIKSGKTYDMGGRWPRNSRARQGYSRTVGTSRTKAKSPPMNRPGGGNAKQRRSYRRSRASGRRRVTSTIGTTPRFGGGDELGSLSRRSTASTPKGRARSISNTYLGSGGRARTANKSVNGVLTSYGSAQKVAKGKNVGKSLGSIKPRSSGRTALMVGGIALAAGVGFARGASKRTRRELQHSGTGQFLAGYGMYSRSRQGR